MTIFMIFLVKKSVAIRQRKRKPMYEPDAEQDPIVKKEEPADLTAAEKKAPEQTKQLHGTVKREPPEEPAEKKAPEQTKQLHGVRS